MEQARDIRIDGIKYMLICFVIFGHFINSIRYDTAYTSSIYSIIYNFHMPLFVLLSGYFFHFPTIRSIHKSNFKLLEPLLIYHCLFLLLWKFCFPEDSVRLFVFEPSPMWYLLSLMWWRYLTFFLAKTRFEMALSVIISVTAFLCINENENVMSIMRTFQFLPFFVFGKTIRNINANNNVDSKKKCKIPTIYFNTYNNNIYKYLCRPETLCHRIHEIRCVPSYGKIGYH